MWGEGGVSRARIKVPPGYLAVGEDGEADGTLFSQHPLDELSIVGLPHRLHHVLQGVGGAVLKEQ